MPAPRAEHPALGPRRKAALALERAATRLHEADAHHRQGKHDEAHEVAKEAHTLVRRAAMQLHEAQRAHEEYSARDAAGKAGDGGERDAVSGAQAGKDKEHA